MGSGSLGGGQVLSSGCGQSRGRCRCDTTRRSQPRWSRTDSSRRTWHRRPFSRCYRLTSSGRWWCAPRRCCRSSGHDGSGCGMASGHRRCLQP
eukprot:205547-Chlamydomonas_euryale.AAC.1